MAVAAPAIQANAVPAVQQPVNREGRLNHRQVTELKKHYLEKQKDLEGPWKTLTFLVTLVATMAVVLLGNITSIVGAILIGLSGGVASVGLIEPLMLKRLDQSNKEAADALMSPGFYEFAMRNPRQLANAEQINATYQRFLAAPA